MQITAAGLTDIGRKRKANQDNFQMVPEQQLFVVADGMGGHAGGETASKITVDTVAESIIADRKSSVGLAPPELLTGAIHRANSAVFATAQKDKKLVGMGTTCVTMLFDSGKIFVGHVGDSRVYMSRPGQIWQITRDHSLVNEKLRAGVITREQMKVDKTRNVITRSVGFESSVLVDLYQREVTPGEIYLACSDGLSGMVDDVTIQSILDQYRKDLDTAVKVLIQKANEHGGDDNVTVVLARVD
jgi:PPM family protein phosphatase